MSDIKKGNSGSMLIDQEIVSSISKGEYSVLNKIYRLYYPTIEHMVIQNSGSKEEAKDIFQEAVLILYDKIKSDDFELKSRLQTFLYSVCRRMWLKQLRDQKLSKNTSDISEIEDVLSDDGNAEDSHQRDRQFDHMEAALEQLGEPCKSILTSFYIQGKNMQEICTDFGYTNANNAKNQKYKCLQRLKKIFFEQS